jgi:cold shock CspA family protein
MRYQGRIIEWNDDRGFGFITRNGADDRVFVHISAFTAIARRPRLGDIVTYEQSQDERGRAQAKQVGFAASTAAPAPATVHRGPSGPRAGRQRPLQARRSRARAWPWLGLALFAVLGGLGIFNWRDSLEQVAATVTASRIGPPAAATSTFHCEGKTHCSQMSSCDEARFYLRNCPNTEMDGDGDGIPCESQWCGHSLVW